MFKSITQKLQPIVLTLLVALLVAVFVLQFGGPQAQGCTAGGANFAARVQGEVITEGDFNSAYALGNFQRMPLETQKSLNLKQHVLQGLIERNLLAAQARELGFEVSEQEVMDDLATEGTVQLSLGINAPAGVPSGEIPVPVKNRNGEFDKEAAKRFIQYHLNRSVSEFARAQIKEALAQRMRKMVRATASVSPRELWDVWAREQDKARLLYVRFSPDRFRSQVRVEPEALRAWQKAHSKQIDSEYESNKHKYTNLEKQVLARHILVSVPPDASTEEQAKAKSEAEELLGRLRDGARFAELAREHSDDSQTAKKGGKLGWRAKGETQARAFENALFSTEPGTVSGVVKSEYGYHIVKVEDTREGDIPKDAAKQRIAENLYRKAQASKLARQSAASALERLQQGASQKELESWLSKRFGTSGGDSDDAGSQQSASNESSSSDGGESSGEGPDVPKVRDTGAFSITANPIHGPFDASPLLKAAFAMDAGDAPDEPMRLGNEFFSFRVTERIHPKREDFGEQQRQRMRERLLPRKQDEALRRYVERLRDRAEAEGAIRINQDVLGYGRDEPAEERRRRPMPPTGL